MAEIIVAAGNPPEYNKSVREFDMVTWDRVQVVWISPQNYNVWKKYAIDKKIHPALLSYLAIRPQNFYKVETDVDGLHFVTARGWEDFSELLYVYEEMQNPVTTDVVYEYLRHSDIAQDVAAYIELYRKYYRMTMELKRFCKERFRLPFMREFTVQPLMKGSV